MRKNLADEIRILEEERNKRIYELLEGRKLESDLIFRARTVAVKGAKLTREMLEGMDIGALKRIEVSGARDVATEIKDLEQRTERQIAILEHLYQEKIDKIKKGDERRRALSRWSRSSSR